MEPSDKEKENEKGNEIKEEPNKPETKPEEKTENTQPEKKEKTENTQPEKKDEPQIQTFQLGDERHPVDPNAEEIEYIGERIRALENLEKCTKLKKLLLRRNVIKKIIQIKNMKE